MKRKLGVDIDETIVWLLPGFVAWHNDVYRTRLVLDDFRSYRWRETLGCSRESAYARAARYCDVKLEENRERFIHAGPHFDFVEGAEAALDLLSRDFVLYGITSRQAIWYEDTHMLSSALWVEPGDGTFFPHITIPDSDGDGLILPVDRIYSTEEGQTKAEICNELCIDTFIDDDAEVTLDCAHRGIRVYLLDRPWNRNVTHPLISRVAGWQDVCDRLSPHKVRLPVGRPI